MNMNSDLINILDANQRRALANIREAVERIWARPLHRYYTDHTVAHSERVITLLDGLTAGMMTTDKRLSSTEAFVLLAATYLHDIGMQDERFAEGNLDQIREHHNAQTAEMIYAVFENPSDAFTIPLDRDPIIVDAIARVSKGHRKVDLTSPDYQPLIRGNEVIRLNLLTALLCFGDELDVDYRRVDLEAMKLMNLPIESQVHWWRCYFVSGVSIVDEYIRIAYRFPQDRPDYEMLIIPLVENEIRLKHRALEETFRANAIKVALGVKPEVYLVRTVQPMPPEVEAQARGAKAPREAFEQAVVTWQITQMPESKQRLSWFYQYRRSLNIGAKELLFLLLSETQSASEGFFSMLSKSSGASDRLKWIDSVDPAVCIQTLDDVLNAHATLGQDTLFELVIDLCGASSSDVQKEFVAKLETAKQQPAFALYEQAYKASPIPTADTFSYLRDLILSDLSSDVKQAISYRILEHCRKTFPAYLNWKSQITRQYVQDWLDQFPVELLDDQVFRSTAFDYIREMPRFAESQDGMEYRRYGRFTIEMVKLLYDRDPGRTVEVLQEIARPEPHMSDIDIELLRLAWTYDPQVTIEKVVHELSGEKYLHNEKTVLLLEMMEAPETDDLLIKDLAKYIRHFEEGSKRWSGGGIPYWRQEVKCIIGAAGRRRIKAAVPHLRTIALRYEPDNLKLECMDALASIGGKTVIQVLVKLLEDKSKRIRDKASRSLLDMKQQRDTVVAELVKSLSEQGDQRSVGKAKYTDAMTEKINILRRLSAIQAIGHLENIAGNDKDETVRKLASETVEGLKKLRKPV
jgi:hypothetical protein